jgi:hypothetical protein
MLNEQVIAIKMNNQLIPPPELAPPSVKHLPLEKRIELWEQLLDESEALVRAGLRAKIGPNGDLEAAYRAWYSRRMDDHDRMQATLAANLSRREAGNGR